MSIMLSYAQGRFVDSDELNFPVLADTAGNIRGFRIFTACRTLNGKIFHLDDHITRLFNSAASICMDIKESKDDITRIVMDLVLRNMNQGDLLIEIMYTGGPVDASGVLPEGPAQLYILTLPLKVPSSEVYANGIHLATFKHQRQFPAVKLMSYVAGVIARKTVVKQFNAHHPLFLSEEKDPRILEGDTFNIFCVRNEVVYTPSLEGVLAGITRKLVIDLGIAKGLEVKERSIYASELSTFDECFITSSTRGVLSVVKIDDIIVGSGVPGMMTLTLKEAFDEYLLQY
jgi:branched-chain amino acid aminotransferase